MALDLEFDKLLSFVEALPAISLPLGRISMGHGRYPNGNWWVKFSLEATHPLAWRHVQELGHVLNLVSAEERLPTVFMPVSPPPYLNGGEEFISWIIESTDGRFTPDECAEWLVDRLPSPVSDAQSWLLRFDEDKAGQ